MAQKHLIVIFVLFFLFLANCDTSKATPIQKSDPSPKTPAVMAKGEALFNNYCARCHGVGAQGTDHGPSFLSKIYEPNHHGDAAFQRAPRNGVRAHHWNFGDMPKIEGIQLEEIEAVIPYIRWLQKEDGVF